MRGNYWRAWFIISVMAILVTACGAGSSSTADTTSGDSTTTSSASDTTATSNGETAAGTPLDQSLLDRADAVDKVETSGGGIVVLAVECESQMGGTLVYVGVDGIPVGTYVGSFEPSAGGDITVQVATEGPAQGARQVTLDEPEYTVTFPDIDGGVELTVSGCTG